MAWRSDDPSIELQPLAPRLEKKSGSVGLHTPSASLTSKVDNDENRPENSKPLPPLPPMPFRVRVPLEDRIYDHDDDQLEPLEPQEGESTAPLLWPPDSDSDEPDEDAHKFTQHLEPRSSQAPGFARGWTRHDLALEELRGRSFYKLANKKKVWIKRTGEKNFHYEPFQGHIRRDDEHSDSEFAGGCRTPPPATMEERRNQSLPPLPPRKTYRKRDSGAWYLVQRFILRSRDSTPSDQGMQSASGRQLYHTQAFLDGLEPNTFRGPYSKAQIAMFAFMALLTVATFALVGWAMWWSKTHPFTGWDDYRKSMNRTLEHDDRAVRDGPTR